MLRYREPGQLLQLAFKLSTIRSILRRKVDAGSRPVAIIADEGQRFVIPRVDTMTQAVGRSARLVNLVMTQNIPLLISALGGQGAETEAHSWIANFGIKVYRSNADKSTNAFASDLCGKTKHFFFGGNVSHEPFDPFADLFGSEPKTSASFNQQWFPDGPPAEGDREGGKFSRVGT